MEVDIKMRTTKKRINVISEYNMSGWDAMERYILDPDITKININGTNIYIEKHGIKTMALERFESVEQGIDYLKYITGGTPKEPKIQMILYDIGWEIRALLVPIAVNGLLISLRKL